MFARALLLIAGLAAGSAALAQPVPYQEGTHYFRVEPAQPTTAPADKVEVIEVFSYACIHCAHFEPIVAEWKKTAPTTVQFSYMPAVFNPTWEVFARAFYAAEVLGIQKQSHEALFKAIHEERRPFRSEQDVAKFFTAYGKTEAQFLDAMKSFGVEMKLNRASQQVPKYGVDGTPTVIVGGKYRITGTSAGGMEKIFDVVKFLVDKELAERAAKKPAAKS